MASKKELKLYLQELSQAELVKEVEKLYARFKNVQEYYAAELGGDTSALVKEYKKRLDNNLEEHFRQRCKKIEAYALDFYLINNTL